MESPDPVLQKPEKAPGKKLIFGIISATAIPVSFMIGVVLGEIFISSSKCGTQRVMISLVTVGVGVLVALVTASVAIFHKRASRISKLLGIFGVISALSAVVEILWSF